MDKVAERSKLPWIVGGIMAISLLCGCAGVLGAWWLWGRGGDEGLEGQGGGIAEDLAIRRAARSGKGHKDPFSAPDGATVHINRGEVMGPRPMDSEILDTRLWRDLGAPSALDVFPSQPYAVDLYQDEGAGAVSRATIDLDRDGKLDEQWRVEGTRVRRAVSTRDDEEYDRMWLWQNGLWLAR